MRTCQACGGESGEALDARGYCTRPACRHASELAALALAARDVIEAAVNTLIHYDAGGVEAGEQWLRSWERWNADHSS